MSNPDSPETQAAPESFEDILKQYEKSHTHRIEDGKQLEGTVVAVTAESVLLDIGYKIEGILPLTAFNPAKESVQPGDKLPVSIKGRDPEGYYELSRLRIRRPSDWDSLERAFQQKETISGTVTGVVKGGVTVDVGVRAFMPASRSGTRDAAELEKLVGQEIRCRITKIDVTEEDLVVDRRVLAEEEERSNKERRYLELQEGDVVNGTVRSLTDYGAFVDIGNVDGLLHVGDISWTRVNNPADVLAVGQEIEAKVLKIDPDKQRISLGMKQLLPHPWDSVGEKYKVGERVRGTVTRVADFGAFVELEPGVEGLIHISEMSWAKKKVRKTTDVVNVGDTVEAVILGLNVAERRLSLGLKQALGDPWADVPQKFPVGSVIEGPVTTIMKFGAFVQLVEGVEGMIHVSEISAEKRINHPQDVLRAGEIVKAQVLAVDPGKRLIRLSIKQLVPTSLDEYLAEHSIGDLVTGRVMDISGDSARVELGEGIQAPCRLATRQMSNQQATSGGSNQASSAAPKADLSSLSAMLAARWKGSPNKQESTIVASGTPGAAYAGQVRSFRVAKLDRDKKLIELEPA